MLASALSKIKILEKIPKNKTILGASIVVGLVSSAIGWVFLSKGKSKSKEIYKGKHN